MINYACAAYGHLLGKDFTAFQPPQQLRVESVYNNCSIFMSVGVCTARLYTSSLSCFSLEWEGGKEGREEGRKEGVEHLDNPNKACVEIVERLYFPVLQWQPAFFNPTIFFFCSIGGFANSMLNLKIMPSWDSLGRVHFCADKYDLTIHFCLQLALCFAIAVSCVWGFIRAQPAGWTQLIWLSWEAGQVHRPPVLHWQLN